MTDAHVVLGHLPAEPARRPHGARRRGRARARSTSAGRASRSASRCEEAARGILAIVDNNMVGALRVVSVERGHDPRDFTLVPFGGAGPLHGCALAELLGIRRVLIPPAPGVLCADGLLAADLKAEFSRTLPRDGQGRHRCGAHDLSPSCRSRPTTGSPRRRSRRPTASRRRVALMRYHGQGGEVAVGWADDAAGVEAAFAAAHEALYGFTLEARDRAGDAAHRGDRPHAGAAAARAGRRQRCQAARPPHRAFRFGNGRGAALRPRHASAPAIASTARPSSPSSTRRRWSRRAGRARCIPPARSF